MTAVTAVMVPYNNEDDNNEDAALLRLDGLLTALRHCRLDAEIIVVDNSPHQCERLAAAVRGNGTFNARYLWQYGRNLMYGPALNLAVSQAQHPHLLYICANHGEARDPSWPLDLLAPLAGDDVAMTGTLQPSGPPAKLGFLVSLLPVHVQGGVFAARTEALAAHPYPDGPLAHWGSDVYQSLRLMAAGWRLVDVPTIRSVWRSDIGKGEFKYVHGG